MHRIHPHVKAVMEEMRENDPVEAVRAKTRIVIRQFVGIFDSSPPFNLEALASFRGLVPSQEAPKHSLDSEIAPQGDRVVLRVNRERPVARQRFSIGHEIGHTLFPEYQLAVRCRKPADRDWADPSDQLEALCDVAASEILFPSPWFDEAVKTLGVTAINVQDLASRFVASPEATIRRFVEVCPTSIAAVFCSWKLKPTEMRQRAADRHQHRVFNDSPSSPVPKLRIDYSVLNDRFRGTCCDHIPKDKSVPAEGPISHAAESQEPCDGSMWLDLGTTARDFYVHALPVYTRPDRSGPAGAGSVALLLRPNHSSIAS